MAGFPFYRKQFKRNGIIPGFSMIIVRLSGGLGNQLFQYAAGRRLSIVNRATLKIDLSWFDEWDTHFYALECFSMQKQYANKEEVAGLTKRSFSRRLLSKIAGKSSVVREQYYKFDSTILSLSDNVYLDGYWQSEKYFSDVSDTIRKDCQFSSPTSGKNKSLQKKIHDTQSVSLHVRRGDYVTNPATNRKHGTCSIDYYKKCILEINEALSDPVYYVFSDDPVWARENLSGLTGTSEFIDHNQNRSAFEDMRLMSLCKHNIIANSSFSWWGAWLNNKKDKIVYAPKNWFNPGANRDTRDLIPSDWNTR